MSQIPYILAAIDEHNMRIFGSRAPPAPKKIRLYLYMFNWLLYFFNWLLYFLCFLNHSRALNLAKFDIIKL